MRGLREVGEDREREREVERLLERQPVGEERRCARASPARGPPGRRRGSARRDRSRRAGRARRRAPAGASAGPSRSRSPGRGRRPGRSRRGARSAGAAGRRTPRSGRPARRRSCRSTAPAARCRARWAAARGCWGRRRTPGSAAAPRGRCRDRRRARSAPARRPRRPRRWPSAARRRGARARRRAGPVRGSPAGRVPPAAGVRSAWRQAIGGVGCPGDPRDRSRRPARPSRRSPPRRAGGRQRHGVVRRGLVPPPGRGDPRAADRGRRRAAAGDRPRDAAHRRAARGRRAPRLRAAASGAWRGSRAVPCELLLRAELEGGGTAVAPLARIAAAQPPAPAEVRAPAPGDGPLVAVCMATYEPPLDLLARQLDSIRAQTPSQLGVRDQRRLLGPRALRRDRGGRRRRPALRRLALAAAARLLPQLRARARAGAGGRAATSRWPTRTTPGTPRSSRRCSAALGDAQLVYSDARIVDRSGALIADTYWEHRRNNHSDLLSLLVANSVTGAASLFPRDAARRRAALPAGPVHPLPRPLDRAHRALAR